MYESLYVYPQKCKHTFTQKVIQLFTEMLFTIAEEREQLRRPLTDEWTTGVYTHSDVFQGQKMDWITDTHYNRDEPWKHYDKKRKPHVTQMHSYELFTLENCAETKKHVHDWLGPGGRGRGQGWEKMGSVHSWHRVSFCGGEDVPTLPEKHLYNSVTKWKNAGL